MSGAAVHAMLMEVLSNHASEWIESALAGKMSWDDFRGLEASMGRWVPFKKVFTALQDDLNVEGARARVDNGYREEKSTFAVLPEDLRAALDALHELEGMLKIPRRAKG